MRVLMGKESLIVERILVVIEIRLGIKIHRF